MTIRKIKGYPNYRITSDGDVINVKTNKQLIGSVNIVGSVYVTLSNKGISKPFHLGKLVLSVFKPNELTSEKAYALYADLNRQNNASKNLIAGTRGDKLREVFEIRKQKRGVYSHTATIILKTTGETKTYFKFRAMLKVDGKNKTLGYFNTYKEAENCYFAGYNKIYGRNPY